MNNGNRLPSVLDLTTWITKLNERSSMIEQALTQQKGINQQFKADMTTLLKNQNDLNVRLVKLETLLAAGTGKAPTPSGSKDVIDVPDGAEPSDLVEGESYVEPV